MSASNVVSLKAVFSAATLWNDRATLVVVAGVALELIALIFFSKEMSRTERAILFVGSILVVLGVGGEYIFGGQASAAGAQLQQLSNQRIAELGASQESDHKIAAKAAAYAAGLGVTVDNLQGFVTKKEKLADTKLAELQRFIAADDARKAAAIAELNADEARFAKARNDAIVAAY